MHIDFDILLCYNLNLCEKDGSLKRAVHGEGGLDLLSFITNFNLAMFILFTALYFYQAIYVVVALFKKPQKPAPAGKNHHFAVLIAARNESAVIGQLISSIKKQKYPQDKIDIFVVAEDVYKRQVAG